MPNLCDGVAGHIQKTLKNSKAYAEGANYRRSGTAALRPITGNPEDGVGSELEAAWDAGWNAADSGTVAGCVDNPGAFTEDATPAAFSFTDVTDADTETVYTSNAVSVTGFDVAVAISVADGSYSINGSDFTTDAGVCHPGDLVRARHTSSDTAETAVDTVVTIGGVADTFTSTTAAA